MRSLILHVDKFATKLVEKSKWPKGIIPEKMKSNTEEMKKCLVVFFCVEKGDTKKQVEAIYKEILKTADEVKTKKLLLSPFVHLSSNIAKPDVAKKIYELLMSKFIDSDFTIQSSHFGYHKSLLLNIKGHPGSFRYREFY